MFRQAYQRGMLTIFYSIGSKPLAIWDTFTRDGYIKRFLDDDIRSMILEIGGTNVSTTYMICPKGNAVLGIAMPFLVMVVKNLKKYFSFEITILDETGTRRRFRVSNFQSTTQVLPLCTVMPIGLAEGWNQIQFNIAEFTRRAYKKQFVEVQKVKINANIRLRRVYFAERLIPEDQLPAEFRLFFPLKPKSKGFKDKITSTEMTQKQVDGIITPELSQKDDKPSLYKGKESMQVIKTVSRAQDLDVEEKSSQILEVAVENPEQATGATADAANLKNAEPDPVLEPETATTELIKDTSEGITTAATSVTTEFLKEPSAGVTPEAESETTEVKKETTSEIPTGTDIGTTELKKETSASVVKESDNQLENITSVEGEGIAEDKIAIGNEENEKVEEDDPTEPPVETEE